MIDTSQPQPQSKDSPVPKPDEIQSDWFLEEFVDSINGTDSELGITLTVGGILVSGVIISGHKYFQGLAASMKILTPEGQENTEEYFKSFGEIYLKPKEPNSKPPSFIHLKDAMFYQPGLGQPIPSSDGVLWRGRISEVDGFMMGSLKTEKR